MSRVHGPTPLIAGYSVICQICCNPLGRRGGARLDGRTALSLERPQRIEPSFGGRRMNHYEIFQRGPICLLDAVRKIIFPNIPRQFEASWDTLLQGKRGRITSTGIFNSAVQDRRVLIRELEYYGLTKSGQA
jgi:hypothetical protein